MALILITGGAGFIGSHLVELLLENNYKVRILDNLSSQVHGEVPTGLEWLNQKNIEFIRGSITDRKAVEIALKNVDMIVHLAAETGTGQSMYEIEHYNKVNILGTALLFDVLANTEHHKVERIILASSRSVYGEGAYVCSKCDLDKRVYPDFRSAQQLSDHKWEYSCEACGTQLDVVATKETDAIKPASIYAATKYAQEDIVRIACSSQNIDYAILRLQNVYGERQSLNNPYTGILSIFSTKVRKNDKLPIFEDGLETRDFVHVKDVVNSFLAAIQSKKNISNIINIGSGVKTTVREVATKLTEAFNKEVNLQITSEYRIGDIRHNFADINNLKNILNYEPSIDLVEGMQRFATWVQTQPLPEDKLEKANAELKARNMMGS